MRPYNRLYHYKVLDHETQEAIIAAGEQCKQETYLLGHVAVDPPLSQRERVVDSLLRIIDEHYE